MTQSPAGVYSCWLIRKESRSILSTESDPQVLHRPWVSKAICARQLTHHHCFIIGSLECLRPLGWLNMFSKKSNDRAKSPMRLAFPNGPCSDGHRQSCRKRWTYLGPGFEVLKTDSLTNRRKGGDSK
jgi:hypothetical protein